VSAMQECPANLAATRGDASHSCWWCMDIQFRRCPDRALSTAKWGEDAWNDGLEFRSSLGCSGSVISLDVDCMRA
jgi:hypothetical protein